MKRVMSTILCILLAATLCAQATSRTAKQGLRPVRALPENDVSKGSDPDLRGIYREAAADTYCIAWYTFDSGDWQGWTRVDNTAQRDTFFHVDNFIGLSGGIKGKLRPIEGTKSMWCGARPDPSDPYLCSWKTAPGYGNNWNQVLQTDPISIAGALSFSFHIRTDGVDEADFTSVEYDAGGHNWTPLRGYLNENDEICSFFVPITTNQTKLRFIFTSDAAWSDEDGFSNSDGACIVDSIRIHDDGSFDNFEDFEGAPVGAKDVGIWHARPNPGFGLHSGLMSDLIDKDPCGYSLGSQVVFFIGSPVPSSTYPGLYDTPFCSGAGGITAPCQDEMIVSPVIDMTKYSTNCNNVQDGIIPSGDLQLLGGTYLAFTVYRDLPRENLVFYEWHVRTIDEITGCAGLWESDNFVYYGPDQAYVGSRIDVSRWIATNHPVQISLGVVDMCDVWYYIIGNCAQHTPSPWFDNVRLYRYKTAGPQWSYRDLDLFQDNFPSTEAEPYGYVRADAANDISANNKPGIRPGDSIVVDCLSNLGGGIDTIAGYPAVYLHLKAHWIGVGAPPLGTVINGVQLEGSYGFWRSTDAGGWDIIQCDFARTQGGPHDDTYMADLNDSLFVPGYTVDYYFTANDNAGIETALPRYARSGPPYFEFTCLPTGASDVLFVDDFHGRGSFAGSVEDYWMSVFSAVLPPTNQPDRYDVNGPSSGVSNGPGSRAKVQQIIDNYYKIVWDSGDLMSVTISDGSYYSSDKSDDCRLLNDWMRLSPHVVGLWVCGDDVAYDLDRLGSPQADTLMNLWCGVDLVNASYYDATGRGSVNPLATGDAAGIFVHGGVPDRFYVYGGCPLLNRFDCLDKTESGQYALDYPDYAGTKYYAAIQSSSTNSKGYAVGTMWFGFSMQYLRDDAAGSSAPIDRFEIARDVFAWMQNPVNADITHADVPPAYGLAQNFPNPFNPTTTIRYGMKKKGVVTLKVYNVAGQHVRTLVDGVRDAGMHSVIWDGKNDRGAGVASGIYFYKMETNGFNETKKIVILR